MSWLRSRLHPTASDVHPPVSYDFTRWNTSWARRQPDPVLMYVDRIVLCCVRHVVLRGVTPCRCRCVVVSTALCSGDTNRHQVWQRRTPGREYFPSIGRGDDSVKGFLQHHGWQRVSARERNEFAAARQACSAYAGPRKQAVQESRVRRTLQATACAVVSASRRHEVWVCFGPATVVVALAVASWLRSVATRHAPAPKSGPRHRNKRRRGRGKSQRGADAAAKAGAGEGEEEVTTIAGPRPGRTIAEAEAEERAQRRARKRQEKELAGEANGRSVRKRNRKR